MSPECPITEDEINALVDGETSGREQKRIAAHVVTCPICSAVAGGTLASKRLLGARAQPVEAPAGSWERMLSALDAADGVRRATCVHGSHWRFDTTQALAFAGLLLIVAGVWHSYGLQSASRYSSVFLRTHSAAFSNLRASTPPMPNVRDVVTPSPGGVQWVPVARALFPLEGELAEHTLYRVDRTPISEFVVSPKILHSCGLTPVRYRDVEYSVRSDPRGTMVAWQSAGVTYILVGRTGPSDLLALASARRSQASTVRSF
ncbi:zf-HC2 domain-containing protein [bacterium]|nr:zf-HC2 domain-containing protein [bacterium]